MPSTFSRRHLLQAAGASALAAVAPALMAQGLPKMRFSSAFNEQDPRADAYKAFAAAMKADFEFHRAVATASGNPYYSDCLASLGQTMIAMPRARLMTGDEYYARDHFDQVVQEHRSILDAIADGDEAAAAAAMRSHLANSRRRFKASARPPA